MRYLTGAALAAVSLFVADQLAAAELCRELSLSYTSGDIDGHLQAPFEGFNSNPPGPSRQSFSDLGYDGFHQLNFKGSYQYAQNRFYLRYDRTRLDNDINLPADPLLLAADTNAQTLNPPLNVFDYGSFVAADVGNFTVPVNFSSQLDLYRLGYQRLFELEFIGRKLILAPGAELAVFDFDYRQTLDRGAAPIAQGTPSLNPDFIGTGPIPWDILDSIDSTAAFAIAIPTDINRSYTKTGLRIGGEAKYWLSERFALTAELYDSVPVDDWPEIFNAKLGLRFKLFAGAHTAVYLHGSYGREAIEYRDEDSFSDDVRAEYRDLLEGGISVRF
jgi:hypothetical protein